MLLTAVIATLQDLIDWADSTRKRGGSFRSTIDQNIQGHGPNSSVGRNIGCRALRDFCTMNGMDHARDVNSLYSIPRVDRNLPAGVGEFMIVWYMQHYPAVYSVADVMPWYSYLVNHGFDLDGLLEPIAMTTPQDVPEVETVTISVDTSIDLTSWLGAAFETLQSETLRRAMVESLIPA